MPRGCYIAPVLKNAIIRLSANSIEYQMVSAKLSAMYEHDDLQLHLATRVGMKGKLYRKQTNSPTGTDKSPRPSDSS